MTSRLSFGAVLVASSLVVASLAGCASRSLNAPPVVDWSNAGSSTRTTSAPTVPRYYTVRRDDTLASIARQFDTTPGDLAQWNALGADSKLRIDQVLRVNAPTLGGIPDASATGAVARPIDGGAVEQRPLGGGPSMAQSASAQSASAPNSANVPEKTGPLGTKRPYSDAALAELSRPDRDGVAAPAPAPAGASPAPASNAPTTMAPASVAWAWPAAGKPSTVFGDGKTKGIDISGKAGEAVLAAADGTVTFVGAKVRGYGNFVIVRHTPQLLSVYAHNRTNLVAEGAVVKKGQKIAEMGDTDADAVKLHFEIRNDSKPVDPLKFLPER